MITILIADDHRLMREGLKKIVQEEQDMSVVGEASNGHEVLRLIKETSPDVLVMDIMMPGLNGFDALKELRRQKIKIPILILSMYPEERYATRVLKAGASGYITKESAPHELVKAIRKVASGGKYISAIAAEQFAKEASPQKNALPHETLSDREFQIFCLLAAGKPVKDIAEELHLGISTIHTYRTRIFEKMNLHNDADLIHYALLHHLTG